MSRTPNIPVALRGRPFSLGEALRAGLTKSSLKGRTWRRLGARLYCWSGLDEDPWQVLRAWQGSLPAEAGFAGAPAARVPGLLFQTTGTPRSGGAPTPRTTARPG